MGTFGITDFNSSSAPCKDGTIDKNNPSNPCINNGGVNWGSGIDWTKLSAIIPKATQTPVLCKDGTTDFSLSSPNARYDNSKVCANNGGRAENQTNVGRAIPIGQAPANTPTKSRDSIFKKLAGAYNKNLIIAVVLVAGYFAYKKFNK